LGGEFGPQDQAELYRNLVRARVGDIVFVVSLPSLNVARGWTEKNVGLLFIDGDHRYEAVRADYKAWFPFVVKGEIIAFHDSNLLDVRRVINEAIKQGELSKMGEIKGLSWFRKIVP